MNTVPDINVISVDEIVTISSPKSRFVKMENRKFFGLSFCTEGQITYTHEGRKFVSDKTCALLLPKGKTYTLHGDETGTFPLINFQCEGLNLNTFLVLPLVNSEGYLKDFEKMKKLSIFSNNNLKIKSIFYDMLSRLFSENITSENLLTPALKTIEKHYTDCSLNNSDLAKLCNISEVYFRRLFAEKTGTTPKQYILDIRIKRAKQLLEDRGLTVTAIAEMCGFGSVYHFCRAFKNATGLTPTQYSNQARKIGL